MAMWDAFLTAVGTKLEEIGTKIRTTFDEIMTYLSTIDLVEIGKNIIKSLADGITSGAAAVANAVSNAVQGAIGKAKSILAGKSASEIGVNTMVGMATGIEEASALPQQALVTSVGGMMGNRTTNNVDNSTNANIEINNSGAGASDNTYYDVTAALGAAGMV